MKFAAMFAQACACGWLVGEIIGLPERERPRGVLSYLIFFALVTLLGFWQLRGTGLLSAAYRTLYVAFMFAAIALMGWVCWCAAQALPRGLFVWLAVAALGFGAASGATAVWFGNKTAGSAALAGMAVLFFAAGQVTGWAALAHPFAAQRSLLMGLGILWTVAASWHLALCVGLTREERTWRGLNAWLPATIGCVIFAAVAFGLHAQAELSRAPIVEMHAAVAEEAAAFDLWRAK